MAFGDGLIEELKLNGVKVRKKPPVDYVTVGDDLDFHFDKISLGIQAIEKGARLIVATMARTWKIGNRLVPGMGALAISVAYGSNVEPIIVGKPYQPTVEITKKLVILDYARTPFVTSDYWYKLGEPRNGK